MKCFLLAIGLLISVLTFSQTSRVGIGTTTPVARLHVNDSNVVFTGIYPAEVFSNYSPPIEGAGTRMMWYAAKGSFRVGAVEGAFWNKDSIGRYSFAAGYQTRARSEGSFAIGHSTQATGNYSTAMGYSTNASGFYSLATGILTVSSGFYSTAFGESTVASGHRSISSGYQTTASGDASATFGMNTRAIGAASFAIGYRTSATGPVSTAMGDTTIASGSRSTAFGWFTIASGDFSTAFGAGARAAGYMSMAGGMNSSANGRGSVAISDSALAGGDYTLAIGRFTKALGLSSIALGWASTASADNSIAIGRYASATNFSAVSLGEKNTVTGAFSFGTGLLSKTYGSYSAAFGFTTYAKAAGSFTSGLFNDSTDNPDPSIGQSTDRIFQIGNGTADDSRSNAITILRNGNTGIGIVNPSEKLVVSGNVNIINSNKGIVLDAQDRPFITRGWDPFTSGTYAGLGRWGLFMEPSALTLGIPNIPGRVLRFSTYNEDGTINTNPLTMASNGNIGIGATNPVARLHVADSNVVFTGPPDIFFTTSKPPIEGAGTRMMWYAPKAAFRAGNVDAQHWDRDSIGNFSFAVGYNTKAKGEMSFASGRASIASGLYSTALGDVNTASGGSSTAIGGGTTASGLFAFSGGSGTTAAGHSSTALGAFTIAAHFNAVALGVETQARGHSSLTFGWGSIARGSYSAAAGFFSQANGYTSFAMGTNLNAKSVSSFVVGQFNDTSFNNRLFEVGNGTADNARSNALTIIQNGNVGIGNTNPSRPLSFAAGTGEKIMLHQGALGDVGIAVWGNELRLHCDNPGSKVSFGTQDVFGAFTEAAKAQINGAYAFSIFGSLWANGTTYASDERFKQNITAITSPLEKLLQINGVEYEMKTSTEFAKNNFQKGKQIGLIAQNVEKVVPEAVNELDGYKGVDYAKLVPLLIESIKEQQKQIEELKQMVQKLQNK